MGKCFCHLNGYEVKDATARKDIEQLKSTENVLSKSVNNLTSEINVERERINNLSSLSEGSTTGDAELLDIRIAEDGSVYSSAGTSVRSQIKNIKNDINNKLEVYNNRITETKIDIPSELWEIGGILTSDGSNSTSSYCIRTKGFLLFDEISELLRFESTELTDWRYISEYNMDGSYVRQHSFMNVDTALLRKNKKYRIAIKNNDEVVNDVNDVLAKCNFYVINYLDLKTDDVYDIEELNLIKSKMIINNASIGNDLTLSKHESYSIALVQVEPSTEYYGYNMGFFNAFLDENKELIGFVHRYDNEPLTSPFITPANAKYLLTNQANTMIGYKAFISKVNQYYAEDVISIKPKTNVLEGDSLLNVVSKLSNKNISLFGDSISSTDYESPYWGEIIKNRTGCLINNYGISGTTLAHTDERHLWDYHFNKLDANAIGYNAEDSSTWGTGNCFCERYTKITNVSDAIVVMGGTNDSNVPLGTWDSTDTSTFYGALNMLFTGLLNKFNGKPILICTPMQTSTSYTSNVIDPLNDLKNTPSTNTLSLQLRAEAIKVKCKQYGLPCLDLFNDSGINGVDTNKSYYRNNDTLHPSSFGQDRLADLIQAELEKLL